MSHLRFCQSFALNRSSKEHFCTSQHKKASNDSAEVNSHVISNPRNSTCLIPFIFATIYGIITHKIHKRHFIRPHASTHDCAISIKVHESYIFQGKNLL